MAVMRNSNCIRMRRHVLAAALLYVLSLPVLVLAQAPARVHLTGIVGLVKPARVFLEVEQAGQPARTLTLREGERDGAIELVSVDAARNRVRIRNTGVEQELSFAGSRPPSGRPEQRPIALPPLPLPPSQSAPIIIGNRASEETPELTPDVTVVGRRARLPIPSMLGPRTFGPGHGRFGDGVPVPPTRTPRPDAYLDAQPPEPQPPSEPRLPTLPTLPTLPQPIDPGPQIGREVPSRGVRESRLWDAMRMVELTPREPMAQPLPAIPPPPPAPAPAPPNPAPTFTMPRADQLFPRTYPNNGGVIRGGSAAASMVDLRTPQIFYYPPVPHEYPGNWAVPLRR